jgi:hypothetical protein
MEGEMSEFVLQIIIPALYGAIGTALFLHVIGLAYTFGDMKRSILNMDIQDIALLVIFLPITIFCFLVFCIIASFGCLRNLKILQYKPFKGESEDKNE